MKKVVASTLTATLVLTFISFFNKGIAFFREVLYAKNFGLGDEFNAYLVSSILPITIYSIIYYISQFYFVPSYNKIVSENRSEEKKFLSDNFWLFFYIGCIITLVLFFFSEELMNFYLSNVDIQIKELSLKIFRVFIFTIPLSAAHSILAAYLNAEYKFTYPAVSIVILNITVVIGLVTLVEKFDIFVIPFAIVLGMLFQLLFLLFKCRKKINFNPLSILRADSFSNVFNTTLLLTLLAELITFSYMLVDRYFLDRLGEGGVASLSYAYQVFELPIKIFTFAIATIIFSKFSKSFHTMPGEELERQFKVGIKLAIFIFTPIALIYLFWGNAVIKILYERGRFAESDTVLTFDMLKIYAGSIVFYSAYAIINKMIYSARLLKNLVFISLLAAIVKICLAFLLIDNYQQEGLAFSTSAAYAILCIAGFIVVIKALNFNSYFYAVKDSFIYLGIGGVCFLLTNLISEYLIISNQVNSIINPLIFFVLYLLTVIYLDTKEVTWLKEIVKTALSNLKSNEA
ncbi:MAG: oligosaccharide flippase family protein [Ignavibacteriae bacterium]|nr:hypothetical protein [Ignavibacteriota bacterium]NOG98219.1 oligosaccharide flippase family protein [Ignavibacteriota bacterium]